VTLEDQIFSASHKSERCVDLLGDVHTVAVAFHHFFNRFDKSSGLLEIREEFLLIWFNHSFLEKKYT